MYLFEYKLLINLITLVLYSTVRYLHANAFVLIKNPSKSVYPNACCNLKKFTFRTALLEFWMKYVGIIYDYLDPHPFSMMRTPI